MAGETILIVDDDADSSMLLDRVLSSKGFSVNVESDGESAVQWCTENSPDLILMDMSLPGIDGLEATRQVRALDGFTSLPIVALTAHSSSEWTEKILAAGCTTHLVKPIRPRSLVEAVNAHLA